jgi:hypothetical protein
LKILPKNWGKIFLPIHFIQNPRFRPGTFFSPVGKFMGAGKEKKPGGEGGKWGNYVKIDG